MIRGGTYLSDMIGGFWVVLDIGAFVFGWLVSRLGVGL